MGKQIRRPPDSGRIFTAALGYGEAARILTAEICKNRSPLLMAPIATTYLFHLELLLKCLLVLESGSLSEGHKPDELFSKLKEATRNKLKDQYASCVASDINHQVAILSGEFRFTDLVAVLRRLSDAYVQARYWYEREEGDIEFSGFIAQVVIQEILGHKPEWTGFVTSLNPTDEKKQNRHPLTAPAPDPAP